MQSIMMKIEAHHERERGFYAAHEAFQQAEALLSEERDKAVKAALIGCDMASCAQRVQEANARYEAAMESVIASHDAALAAVDAFVAAAWAKASEQEKVEGWKATLRRGDSAAKVKLAAELPDGHPFLRWLARDSDMDVRTAAQSRMT